MSGRRAPYEVGDRARVLHAGRDGATRLGVLEVESCEPAPAREGRLLWRVVFVLEPDGWPVTVGPDGRDWNGYVEPVRGS